MNQSSILLMDPGTSPRQLPAPQGGPSVAAVAGCWVKVEVAAALPLPPSAPMGDPLAAAVGGCCMKVEIEAPLPFLTLRGKAAEGCVFLVKVESPPSVTAEVATAVYDSQGVVKLPVLILAATLRAPLGRAAGCGEVGLAL